MIQRIQSVYLLFVALFMLAVLFVPTVSVVRIIGEPSQTLDLLSFGSGIPSVIILITGILAVVTIFLYKRRKLQIRLCYCIYVLILLSYGSISFWLYYQDNAMVSMRIGSILPVMAVIITSAAIRRIEKDEKLVRSLDRLR